MSDLEDCASLLQGHTLQGQVSLLFCPQYVQHAVSCLGQARNPEIQHSTVLSI